MVVKNTNEEGMGAEKKSIRNIPLTKKQTRELEKIEEALHEGVVPPSPVMPAAPARRTTVRRTPPRIVNMDTSTTISRKRSPLRWIAVAIIGLVLVYGIAHMFKNATVSIAHSEEVVTLSNSEFALMPATTTIAGIPAGTIVYQKKAFDVSATTTVAATGVQQVQKKASGKLVVYNDSASSQLLVETTRFQTPEGLVFRLNKTVTVSAKTNVTVDVTADQAGEKYNVGPKTFTLPGLQGTAKAKTIYAKSSASMTGGSIGSVAQTSADELSASKGAIQDSIQRTILEKASSQIPEGYVLLQGGMTVEFGDLKQVYNQSTKTATISQTALATIYYLEKLSLTDAMADKSTAFVSTKALVNTESLTAEIKTPASLNISGTATVRADFDKDTLAKELAGKTRSEALSVIKGITGVKAVEISLRPWWERRLPDAGSIEVKID
jgi:hypothetical protein